MDRYTFLRSNPSCVFFDFWEDVCEYKPLKEQLKILYDERFLWFNQVMASVLSEENKKLYDLQAVKLALPAFEKAYPKDTRPLQTVEAIEKNKVSKQVIDIIEDCLHECERDWHYSESEKHKKAFAAVNSILLLADAPFSPDSVVFWATEADKSIKEEIYEYGIKLSNSEEK